MRRDATIITLCIGSPGFVLAASACGTDCSMLDLTDVWLYIRRRGERDWLIKYPAWELNQSGDIVFRLDDQFPTTHGRYEAEMRIGDEVIGSVEIYVPRGMRMSGAGRELKPLNNWHPPKPEGVTNMYEQIENFRAYLCDVLEKDGMTLPLGADDTARLCGLTLCRPAQLVLYDGYQREVIEWTCNGGVIEITRGQGGTMPQRFPKGTEVRFEWTEANVTNAMQGC